ncbi:MAG: hypothetical protein OJF62_001886 [Pseudolabrys sp.]|jgi:DNA-binding GntR family transcriptional regulator|nr:hypothetical protein [Pseudolabrys sp.]
MNKIVTQQDVGRARFLDVLHRLRTEILNGTVEPNQKLSIDDIARRYDVSTGTLREVISRLVAEQLLIMDGQKGVRVTPISVADIDDIINVRILLETHALRESMRRGGHAWESGIVASQHKLSRIQRDALEGREQWNTEWHRTNREFHLALGSACGSPRILQILNSLFDQSQRYGLRFLQSHGAVIKFANDHNEIIEAILAHDMEKACERLRAHLEQVRFDLTQVPKLSSVS